MIIYNVLNPNKKNKIISTVFHLFYPDINTSILFDKDLKEPIIWGSKNEVMNKLKKINEIADPKSGMNKDSKVRIYSYITTTDGYRRTDTYNGPIETIGKYIKHI